MGRKLAYTAMLLICMTSVVVTITLLLNVEPCWKCGRTFHLTKCEGQFSNDIKNPLQNNFKTNQKYSLLEQTDKANEDYLEKIYFVGDSRTVGLSVCEGIDKTHLLGKVGMNLTQSLTEKVVKINSKKTVSIPEAIGVYVPEIIIVNFGVNGVAWSASEEEMVAQYEKLIDLLEEKSKDSIIIIQSILPVSSSYEKANPRLNNDKIDRHNKAIYEMTKRRELYYLNTADAMKNKYNNLKDEYSSDGLHFNKQGNQTIIDDVLTHAVLKEGKHKN